MRSAVWAMVKARPFALLVLVPAVVLAIAVVAVGAYVVGHALAQGATGDVWGRLAACGAALVVAELRPRRPRP